jgi:hypothetical protein
MTTPSGTISANNVNTELLAGGTTTLTFNETRVRDLAQRPTGQSQISLLDLRNKNRVYNISSPKQNLNLYNQLVADGWNGSTPLTCVIASGVYIWSDNNALAALDTGGPFAAGLTLINYGYIIGKGGQGGSLTTSVFPGAPVGNGRTGGAAMSIGSPGISFTNYGYVAGGGGGGGAAGNQSPFGGSFLSSGGGGGAGGGAGGPAQASGINPYYSPATGGAGGTIGGTGANGVTAGRISFLGSGGGGGRILPGVGGPGAGGGPGTKTNLHGKGGGSGGGGGTLNAGTSPRISGAGGSAGGAGGNGTAPVSPPSRTLYSYGASGGGGGWGASGGTGYYYNDYYPTGGFLSFSGGVGGKAISLNGYAMPISNSGTTYGAIS